MNKTIYVVDDTVTNLSAAESALENYHNVVTIPSGKRAIALLEKIRPDLILLDLEMPEMNGFDVLRILKGCDKSKHIPVILLTNGTDYDSKMQAYELGVVDFIGKPLDPAVLLNRVEHHIYINKLVSERSHKLYSVQKDLVLLMADILENRDEATGEHLGLTGRLVRMLLERMLEKRVYYDQIKEWDFDLMAECSILHDVGKVSTPDTVFKKCGKLTTDEYEVMKQHAVAGERILDRLIRAGGENILLHNARMFAVFHHERWNGTGYPNRLSGEDIPLQGRIMAIVDAFDALVSKRFYKDPLAYDQAVEIIVKERGKHFDPQLVDVFCDIKDGLKHSV